MQILHDHLHSHNFHHQHLRQLLEPYDSNEAMHLEKSENFKNELTFKPSAEDALWEEETETGDDGNYENEDDHEGFASQWISAVARATMTLYIEKIFQIETLTTFGATQLSVDISHLCNVLTVLSVKPDPTLAQILTLLNIQTKEEFVALPFSIVASMIGKKRGWPIEAKPEASPSKTQKK